MNALLTIAAAKASLKIEGHWINGIERSDNGLGFRFKDSSTKFQFSVHGPSLAKRQKSGDHTIVIGRGRINGVDVVGFLNKPHKRPDGTQVATIGLQRATASEATPAGISSDDPLYQGDAA